MKEQTNLKQGILFLKNIKFDLHFILGHNHYFTFDMNTLVSKEEQEQEK
jgi:hypothetical protein